MHIGATLHALTMKSLAENTCRSLMQICARVRHNTCLKSEVGAKHMFYRCVNFSQAGPEVGGINVITRGIKSNIKQKSVIRLFVKVENI